MCLTIIDGKPKSDKGFGYKIMARSKWFGGRYHKGGLWGEFIHDLRDEKTGKITPYRKGVWYDANTRKISPIVCEGELCGLCSYRMDFHIYTSRPRLTQSQLSWNMVVRVEYEGAHTVGRQDSKRVVVAKYMRIVEVLDAQRPGTSPPTS